MRWTKVKENFWDFIHRIGWNRYEYMMNKAPKDPAERARFRMHNHDLLGWPHSPCNWLCGRKEIKRFHFTCLTCWQRRLHFKRRGYENLKKYYRRVVMVYETPSGKSFVLPEHYRNYGLFIPTDEHGRINAFKEYALKWLLTLAERIAEL